MNMRKQLLAFVLTVTFACHGFAELASDQLAQFKQQLGSPDPKVRASAFDLLGKSNAASLGNDVLPSLSKALSDQDAKVRSNAALFLAAISMDTSPKNPDATRAANTADLRSYAPLQPALVAASNDPSENTRKNALIAYLSTFEVPPWLQDVLVNKYDSEQLAASRGAILAALTIDGSPTPTAKKLLTRVAESPTESPTLAQVIQDSKAPPIELLPHFVTQFSAAHEGPRKALFARAIGKFGASAKEYIPLLEKAADVAPDAVTKQSIARTAATLRNSH
jgi:HEAT repeat protein